MSLSSLLFGSETETQELPKWYEDAAQANISRAQDIAEMGYMPYYGVDVAGFTPMQQSAMQNTNTLAQQYGMSVADQPSPYNMVTDPTTGIQGYRSGDIFDQARNELKQRAPAQYDYYNSMIIDPVTGEYGSRTRGGQALGLLDQLGADTTGLNAGSSSSDYDSAMQGANFNSDQFRQNLQNLVDNPALMAGMSFLGGPLGGLIAQIAKAYVNNQATQINENGGSSTPYLHTDRGISDDGNTYNSSYGTETNLNINPYTGGTRSAENKAAISRGLEIASKQNDVASYTD